MNKVLCYGAKISLFHAKRKCPNVISTVLWPFCYKNTDEHYNHLHLNIDGISPIECLMGHREELVAGDFHTWGCPVFILDAAFQNSRGIGQPKWDPLSRAGVYLGQFLVYAGNVALVLNLQTGHVSLEYQIIFYDEFTTVPYLDSVEAPPNWTDLIKNHTESTIEEAFNIAS
eukprot:7666354-Ditylum_brightwellii.AAC.1